MNLGRKSGWICAVLLGLVAQSAQADVWKTTQQWTPEAEHRYQDWLLHNLDKSIFTRPGPLQGVRLDCADSVYSMRMLFSFEEGLPFVIHDPTGSGTISNAMTRFDGIPAGPKRFRAFAQFIYGVTSTESLPADSYSPAISRDEVHGGAFMRTDPASHHSWTIQQVDDTGNPHLFFASRPARTTLFERDYIPTMGFMFPHGNTPESEGGFRRWRHPEDVLKPEWQVPGYSLEQYQIPIAQWAATVQRKLELEAETPEQRVVRTLGVACQEAQDRVAAVEAGIARLRAMGSRQCMTASEFDDYSTPSKDFRLKSELEDVADAYAAAGNGSELSAEVSQRVRAVLAGEASANDPAARAYCLIRVSPTEELTLGQVYDRSTHDKLSSNPLDPLAMRWGDQAGPSARAAGCPSY